MTNTSLLPAYQKQRKRIRCEVDSRLEHELSRYTRKISEIVGEPLPSKAVLARKDVDSIHDRIDSTITLVLSTFDTDWKNTTAEEAQTKLREFLDKLLGQFYTVPKGQGVLVSLRTDLDQLLYPRSDNPIQATFYEVSQAAGWLVRQLFQQNRIIQAQSFFTTFAKSGEAFSLAQIYVQNVLPSIRRIGNLENKYLDKSDVQFLLRSYELMAGMYEKLSRIIIILKRISLGETSDYHSVSRTMLANLLKEINKEPRLRPIASRVNTKIRNAIAHPSYRVYYSKRRIRFEQGLDITWNQFRDKTLHFAIALVALTMTPFLHYLKEILEYLDQAIAPHPSRRSGA